MASTSDRISATERREQILDAATRVFGEQGYYGATTDRIAREAGISQPYVLRLFGSKERLFIDVLEGVCTRILESFDDAITEAPEGVDDIRPFIGDAYVSLVKTERGILLSLMQGFILGHDPAIGPVARAGFMRIYDRLRAVMPADEAMRFMAQGMLINTLIASGLPLELKHGRNVEELLECAFGDELGVVLEELNAGSRT
jgi:AcrR family transcriptional regulator